jgi:hypothetical protein
MEYFAALVTVVFSLPWAMRFARLVTEVPATPVRRVVRR